MDRQLMRGFGAALAALLLWQGTALPQGMMLPKEAVSVSGDTWSSGGQCDASITLSNSNRTATSSTSSSWKSCMSTPVTYDSNTEKVHFELVVTAVDASAGWIGGIRSGTGALSSYVGSDTHGLGFQPSSSGAGGGSTYFNGVGTFNGCHKVLVVNDVVAFEIDWVNTRAWCSIDGGATWNNGGTANPSTNVGGVTFSGLADLTNDHIGWSGFTAAAAADGAKMRTCLSSFTATVSSGYTAWNPGC